MGILFIILLIVIFELIQILSSRFKIIKWVLPTLSFLSSISIILALITFEQHDSVSTQIEISTLIFSVLYFIIFNIPTIIFISTNFIMNKKSINDKNFFRRIKIGILITLISLIILFVLIQMSALKNTTKVNKDEIKNVTGSNLTVFNVV